MIYARRKRKIEEQVRQIKETGRRQPTPSNVSGALPTAGPGNIEFTGLLSKPSFLAAPQETQMSSIQSLPDQSRAPSETNASDMDISMANTPQEQEQVETINRLINADSASDHILGMSETLTMMQNTGRPGKDKQVPASGGAELAMTYGDVQPFNLPNGGIFSEEILDMAQAHYVDQCSAIPGSDPNDLRIWATFCEIVSLDQPY